VPYNGKVYELDGLKPGPILLGDVAEGGDWLTVAKQQLQARIEKYASSEIRFNLMGLVRNKKDALAEEAAMLTRRKAALEAAATGAAAMDLGSSDGLGAGWTMAEDAGGRAAQLTETQDALAACLRAQQEEDAKVAAWKMENLRRKHNYVPFVVNLLRILAEHKHLTPMYEKAKEKKKEQAAAGGGKK
jgi:ubiquitin carboxyl-terminal hydrolase L5